MDFIDFMLIILAIINIYLGVSGKSTFNLAIGLCCVFSAML